MPEYRKKLIEVALPLEAINKEAAREKSIRHGHPSTLHLWWRELVRFKRSLAPKGRPIPAQAIGLGERRSAICKP